MAHNGNNRAEEDEQQLEGEGGEDGDDENNMMADLVYICGPPGMPEDIIQGMLQSNKNNKGNGVKKFVRSAEDVHFEKWW